MLKVKYPKYILFNTHKEDNNITNLQHDITPNIALVKE